MPEISRFYGITIYMFYKEHNPPYIHAKYQEFEAVMEIESGKCSDKFPGRALRMINEWISKYKTELIENWELAEKRNQIKKIKPLN